MSATLNTDDAMLVALRGSLDDAAKKVGEQRQELKRRDERDGRQMLTLFHAIKALRSLPDDALGFGESGGAQWPLRDELVDAIILTSPDPAKLRAAVEADAERTKVDSQASGQDREGV